MIWVDEKIITFYKLTLIWAKTAGKSFATPGKDAEGPDSGSPKSTFRLLLVISNVRSEKLFLPRFMNR